VKGKTKDPCFPNEHTKPKKEHVHSHQYREKKQGHFRIGWGKQEKKRNKGRISITRKGGAQRGDLPSYHKGEKGKGGTWWLVMKGKNLSRTQERKENVSPGEEEPDGT